MLIFRELDGTIEYKDIIEEITYTADTDEKTGHREKVIIDSRDRSLVPTLVIKGNDDRVRENTLPVETHIVVEDGEKVQAGQVLADRKSTRLNSSHVAISYAVFCLKKKKSRCPNG